MSNQPCNNVNDSLYDQREHDACGVGFIARLDGRPDHSLVEDGIAALSRMAHRGGSGCGPKAADGAGLLFPMPREYVRRVWRPVCGELPEEYGLGQIFLPRDKILRDRIEELAAGVCAAHGLAVLGWRDTPTRPEILQAYAKKSLPVIRQILLTRPARQETSDPDAFERLLYVVRRHWEREVFTSAAATPDDFHVASFSSRSVVYKGMLPGGQMAGFYADLAQRDFAVHFAIFHERYSTNTTPAWRLAQPFRCLAHNGEINTLRGNQASMKMREPYLASPLFGDDIRHLKPVLDEAGSDSAMLDNAMELLTHGGRSLAHSAMMLLPEPFTAVYAMGDGKRAFYEYHAPLMEPWDGPAALVFTDGERQVGAMLDRNALRPCRYAVTREGTVLLASEAGVLDIPEERISRRGRLQPRRMLMVDFARRRVVSDAECKNGVIYAKPYRHWVRENGVSLRDLPKPHGLADRIPRPEELLREQKLFGFSAEEVKEIIAHMAANAQEPTGSMGVDTPLAVLSQKPQLLFNYFKQRFAQVTNPPIDPLREGLVMTLTGFAGRRGNLLEETPEHYGVLRLSNPVLLPNDLERVLASEHPAVNPVRLDMLFDVPSGAVTDKNAGLKALKRALKKLCREADEAVDAGRTIIVLSDAMASERRAPIPSLLAVSALHQHLLRGGRRCLCGIIADAGEAREVMHLAQLIAFGAAAVHPRTACLTVDALARDGKLGKNDTHLKARAAYSTALQKGLLKAFSRMGISTLRSFTGGQSFEAVGLARELVNEYFSGTPSRIGGAGLDSLAHDAIVRHRRAFCENPSELADSGRFKERRGGEKHLWSAKAVRSLHKALRENDDTSYREYAAESDEQAMRPVTLRGLLRFKEAKAIPLAEVEPEENIRRRFVGAAMSFGSISLEAHKAVAIAFNRAGGRSNCGEGGEDPARNLPLANGDNAKSRVRQIASGRFGVTAYYLAEADEIQIKMAQGAKPGEGGQLPAHKVLPEIARVRGTVPGVTLISPPPHHDVYSIEDLAQLIFDLKRLSPRAKISVKLVAGANVGTIASGVAKAGADIILISGHDGGTGASPRSAISCVGLPWEMGLAETQAALSCNGLRKRVILQADGQLRTGRDIVMAALFGADEYGFGSGLLVALGCCMLRVCHLGACPAGIATQDERLRRRQKGTADHVERYLRLLARDVREHMARLGFRAMDEMIGRSDMLEMAPLPPVGEVLAANPGLDEEDAGAWLGKLGGLDYSPLLHRAEPVIDEASDTSLEQTPSPFEDSPLETSMLDALLPGLEDGRLMRFEGRVRNTDRSVCARLSGEIARRFGNAGMKPGSIDIILKGTAGQSAGAWLPRGVHLSILGEANDYAGKGLSGGVIAVAPAAGQPERGLGLISDREQAAIGNVALYGATSGDLYVAGSAGERFAVRNSGATAVVEGVGDHGCEYMTGGVVVVLGSTGYNFGAGMSGGLAFVYDRSETFQTHCNMDGVDIESVWEPQDVKLLKSTLEKHLRHTASRLARAVLEDWEAQLPLFLKVTPIEYRRALERMKQSENPRAESVPATEEVFHHHQDQP